MAASGKEESPTPRSRALGPSRSASRLNDSPAGLLTWIVEKFRAWSDCDGDLEKRLPRDQLLTNVMLYGRPVLPAGVGDLVGEAGACETLVEVVEHGVVDVDAKPLDGVGHETVMACVGQSCSASATADSSSTGTSGRSTTAYPSSTSANTSGHFCTQ